MAKQGPIVVNEILCYIQGIRNTATVRQIHEGVISLFNGRKLNAALLLYHAHRGKGFDFMGKDPREAHEVHFGLDVGGRS